MHRVAMVDPSRLFFFHCKQRETEKAHLLLVKQFCFPCFTQTKKYINVGVQRRYDASHLIIVYIQIAQKPFESDKTDILLDEMRICGIIVNAEGNDHSIWIKQQ